MDFVKRLNKIFAMLAGNDKSRVHILQLHTLHFYNFNYRFGVELGLSVSILHMDVRG